MAKVNALLHERLGKSKGSSKMAALAKKSTSGQLNTFAGVFALTDLTNQEKNFLEELLLNHSENKDEVENDLHSLISITAEVKAINNQAALLHGERIKKAQTLLTGYQDGAFTSWLLLTYGNRQTPYNFLQYYNFWTTVPKTLHPQIETMPRQAIYTLSSREGAIEKKIELVEEYTGETKEQLMLKIRELFPLASEDKRRQNQGETVINKLHQVHSTLSRSPLSLRKKQKQTLLALLEEIEELVSTS
jgi:hypothetical protein